MPNQVYATKTFTLQDDIEVTVKPLVIAKLRRFLKAWKEIENVGEEDDGFDVFINCCGVALEDNFKGKFDSLKSTAAEEKDGKFLSEEYFEYLANVLELDTIYEILDVAGGIKLNDPKLMEAARAELVGKTLT